MQLGLGRTGFSLLTMHLYVDITSTENNINTTHTITDTLMWSIEYKEVQTNQIPSHVATCKLNFTHSLISCNKASCYHSHHGILSTASRSVDFCVLCCLYNSTDDKIYL